MLLWLLLLACRPGGDAAPGETGVGAEEGIQIAGEAPRSVLMVSIDTLRRDAVGRYGDGESDTPFLDGLLSSGVVLDDHRSCSNWTYGAVLCALSGRTGVEVGWVPESNGRFRDHTPDLEVLPVLLGEAGFGRWLVTTNPYLGSLSGFDDEYDQVSGEGPAMAEHVTRRALDAIDQAMAGGDPWFVHAHFIDPHTPYDPPADYLAALDALAPVDEDLTRAYTYDEINAAWGDYDGDEQALLLEHMRLRYAAEVRYLDDQLAALWQELAARGALDDALVVLWSDHGEQLAEHGALTHGQSLYRQEVDAIAAFIAPGLAPLEWSGPTTHADLTPTILSLLGLPTPAAMTGVPAGAAPADRARYAVHRKDFNIQSVAVGDLELRFRWQTASLALYDRARDPDELEDRYDPADPDAQALWELLAPRVDALTAIEEADR